MSYNFPATRTTNPKEKPDQSDLGFGRYFTDHMFIMDYDEGEGWHDGRIVPYGPISLDPASCVLHYSQMMFEGMKAYKSADGHVMLFRPEMNAKRLNRTNERMCIPPMDEELFLFNFIDGKAAGGITLGIRIYEQHFFTKLCKAGCKVYCCCGLAYTTFLICYRNDLFH